MIGRTLDWLDHRTGYRALLKELLYERIPGGARWRYVWGSTLVFTFAVQVITGVFLAMAYSPSEQTAWESVYYLQHEMQGGWLLRGIHHFAAQAMVVLLALHLAQVVIDGAYKAPREVNFWLGLILMLIVLGLALTGYLLPWDQKGYWATRVATNLMALTPGIGTQLQELVVGGQEYGHHTVTRFFAVHAILLPGVLVLFLIAHLAVFRRHGICAHKPQERPETTFWPDQVLRDGVACLAVLVVVLALTIYFRGADLSAPADGARPYDAARPEWYFLFLFQFLKLFEGHGATGEVVGAIVIPGVVVLLMFLMPLIAKAGRVGHWFNLGMVGVLLAGAAVLTGLAWYEDRGKLSHRNGVWVAGQNADLAKHLASQGIPPQGATYQMRNHPQAVALKVITDNCLQCHTYVGPDGVGYDNESPAAPNLYAFGRPEWVQGLLDPKEIAGKHYFGQLPGLGAWKNPDGTSGNGDMAGFVQGDMATLEDDNGKKLYDAEGIKKVAAALAAEAGFKVEESLAAEGRSLIQNPVGCAQCHKFHDAGETGAAPDLTGWGSRPWLIGMISDPNAEGYYAHLGDNQRMPAFAQGAAEGPSGLPPEVIDYIATWVRGEWYHEPRAAAQPTSPGNEEQ
jgi:ubiquinol-cytochrome c reductase cytochrome b subunit